jgi:hypothetical protein
MDFRGDDGYDYGTLYAEFTLTDLNTDQAEDEDVYRVVGNADFLGNWDPAFEGCVLIEAAPKEYVGYLRDVPAGNYEIKITKNGSWEECWGDPLESDGNYCFTVVQQQDVFVKFRIRDGQGTIHLSGGRITPPLDNVNVRYVRGSKPFSCVYLNALSLINWLIICSCCATVALSCSICHL